MVIKQEIKLTWGHEERDPEPAWENSISQTLQVGSVEGQRPADQNIEDNTKALKQNIIILLPPLFLFIKMHQEFFQDC